jgi:predicted Zn-dependent protease
VGSSLLLLNYSRAQEIQADRLGVKYMSRLGYDPYEAMSAHKVLEKSANDYLKRLGKSLRSDSLMSGLLSTHPRQEVRISEIQAMIRQLPPYRIKERGKFSKIFQNATRTIRKTNKIYFKYDKARTYYQEEKYTEAEKTLQEAISQNSHQSSFHDLLGLLKIRQKSYGEAKNAFQKPLSIDSGYQPSVYGMGLVYFFEKKYSLAIQEFKKSLDIFPGHVQSHFGIGKSYFQLAQYSKAISYLRNFASAVPKHPEVHGMLGICYDNKRDIRSAAIEYRNQLVVAPDTELGHHAQKRLNELAPFLKKQ